MSPEDREKLIPLVTAVFIFLGGVFILKPFIAKTIDLNDKLKDEKVKLSKLKKKLEVLENLNEEQLDENVKKVETILPSQKPVITVLNSLFNLANQQDVILGEISFSPGEIKQEETKEEKKKVNKEGEQLAVNFNITGNLEDITDFLDKLELQTPLSRLEGFGLNVENKQETTTALNLKVFYLPLPETLGKISDPLPVLNKKEQDVLAELENFEDFTADETVVIETSGGKSNPFKLN